MIFTTDQLRIATHSHQYQAGPSGAICTDSRYIQPGDWFVALVGDRFDGHNFLNKAAEKQCAGIIAQHIPNGWTRGYIKVEDTLVALQNIARYARNSFQGPVIAITGSAGKTTTRAMIGQITQFYGKTHETKGNFNNHIGLPLSILTAPKDAACWVLELGMNHLGEIDLLQEICRPSIRLITNVGAAHLQGVGSLAGVAQAKGELFAGAQANDLCCINIDDPLVSALPIPSHCRTIRFGRHSSADIQLLDATIEHQTLSTAISIRLPDAEIHTRIPSPGLHLASNACAAAAVGYALGIAADDIATGLQQYQPVGARLRLEPGPRGIQILNDAYNANPLSMRASLQTLASLANHRRVAMLGDMLELGETELQAHKDILSYALDLNLDLLGVAGPRFVAAAKDLGAKQVLQASTAHELGEQLAPLLQGNELLLLKGSRGMAMEKIVNTLGEQ